VFVKVWVNGELVEPDDARVSVFDHGLTVGDGVFETCKVVGAVPFALTRHLDRLVSSARGLGLPDPDLDTVRRAVAETLAAAEGLTEARLRITYTGGMSPLGSGRGDSGPTLVVAAGPLRGWAPTEAVVTVPWTRNERAATAGLKTTSYADNVVALAYAKERGATEAIFGNTAGELCEGTGTNVFVVLDGRLVTPPLSSGCLAGVSRALVLEWYGAEERPLPLAVLAEADEVFLTSSTRDVQPVHAVDGRRLDGVPGPITRQVQKVFAERSAADLDPPPLT
jgi:branched-chain amino acid aminotransferase